MYNFLNSQPLHEHRALAYKLTSNWMEHIGYNTVIDHQKQYLDGYSSVVISDFFVFCCAKYGVKDPAVKAYFDPAVFFCDNPTIYYQKAVEGTDLYPITQKSIQQWLTF